ncbi:MAG: hypothetical protein KatS3mg111_0135 [Pirellulaceae bacterium]|nr:MAG: hypothetical protein KatS3mg111_0135 [Pirellulaceae bacterium]
MTNKIQPPDNSASRPSANWQWLQKRFDDRYEAWEAYAQWLAADLEALEHQMADFITARSRRPSIRAAKRDRAP